MVGGDVAEFRCEKNVLCIWESMSSARAEFFEATEEDELGTVPWDQDGEGLLAWKAWNVACLMIRFNEKIIIKPVQQRVLDAPTLGYVCNIKVTHGIYIK